MKTTTNKFYIITLITFNLLFFQKAFSQKAILEKNQIVIGDQIRLSLQIDLKKGQKVKFPEFDKEIIKDVEIIEKSFTDTINNGKTLEKSFIITAFDDSTFQIPPFKFLVNNDTVISNSLTLKVGYYRPDSLFISKIDTSQLLKITDIKPVIESPWTFQEFWNRFGNLILIILLVAIITAAVVYSIIKRKKNQPIFIPAKPKEPSHITAFRMLEELKAKQLWQKGKIKEYYTELTDIVRIYIENEFDIPAPEFTTHQIIEAISRSKSIKKEALAVLKPLLSLADLVKFAKAEPFEYEHESCYKSCLSFIELTKTEVVEIIENTELENTNTNTKTQVNHE